MQNNHRDEKGMSQAVLAGMFGAAFATVAVALTQKSNRDKLKQVYDQLMHSMEDLKTKTGEKVDKVTQKAQRVKEVIQEETGATRNPIEKQKKNLAM